MISFRTATTQDAQALTLLVNSAYRGDFAKQGWTTEAYLLDGQRTDVDKILQMIETPSSQIEIAFDTDKQEEIIGCVYLDQAEEKTLYFGMLTVNPTLQSQGLGKLLLAHLETVALKKNCNQIRMTVISVRQELIAYYERRGYQYSGKTEPFPSNDPSFGIPKIADLHFLEYIKKI